MPLTLSRSAQITAVFTLILLGLQLVAVNARADSLESVLMPGKVIEAHADIEMECSQCHVVFDRAAQPALCGECHEDVMADIKNQQGFHGRQASAECLDCHFEHRGRDVPLAPLDPDSFDHTQTDFLLQGEHTSVDCVACHEQPHKFSEAPGDCVACHQEDDIHQNALGEACTDCHDEKGWPGALLDHEQVTGFQLLFSHAEVGCTDCHQDHHYEQTPTACSQCHGEDDAHDGLFATECEQCHRESEWDDILFVHDRDTEFLLKGLHESVACDACHLQPLAVTKTPNECSGCHQDDDPHAQVLGNECESCHSADGWSELLFEHNTHSQFKLDGSHRNLECSQCHSDPTYQTSPSQQCVACHQEDDHSRGHQGQFGKECATCHSEKSWSVTIFNHANTDFPLLGEHASILCKSCHQDDQFSATPTACVACHDDDDIHQQRLGPQCESCHQPQSWTKVSFDHDLDTDFILDGKHRQVECTACHLEPIPGKILLSQQCSSCHADEDVHFGSLSDQCESCHQPSDWRDMRPNAREWAEKGGPPTGEVQ